MSNSRLFCIGVVASVIFVAVLDYMGPRTPLGVREFYMANFWVAFVGGSISVAIFGDRKAR